MSFLRSWRDYRRFKALDPRDRNIVFYAESRQDWHHLEPIVRHLTGPLARTVCYVTSDPNDPVLREQHDRLLPLFIKEGFQLILFFQMLQADVMVLTMLDLGNFHLKRSKHPVHYVYVFHCLGSTHMIDLPGSYDHYDSILCAGPHHMKEIRRREELEGLPAKELVPHGYTRLEALMQERAAHGALGNDPPVVLVAPTWGEHSLLNVCGEALVDSLLDAGYRVILRPHYQTVKLTPNVVEEIKSKHAGHPGFEYVGLMGESDSLFRSDVLVCDWSSMAIEYALGLEKPVLFVDVPKRVRNPDWEKLGIEPAEVAVRHEVGVILAPDRIRDAPGKVRDLLAARVDLRDKVAELREQWVYNVGRSAEVGAEAIARIADAKASERGTVSAATVRST